MSNPGDFAYTVKQQADIVRIVGDYVKLKKSGAQNLSGLCPFHKEKSPSFSVHSTRQFYHCFGCGASGDVFSFVQKIENLSFPEAVRLVAQKLGIAMPKPDYSGPMEAREARQRGVLIELHEQACTWFQEQLRRPEAAKAREYLTGRGLNEEALRTFRVGYAPDSGFLLRDKLRKSFDEDLLKMSGLFSWKTDVDPDAAWVQRSGAAIYSKFRNRVIFPICNEQGKVIAFTGRTLDQGNQAGPKYLNSPETPLYSKGRVLFNLHLAKEAMRRLDYAILVEGQMDCLSVYMAGFHNVIATSGTAFTETQVRLLGRFTKNVVVSFDPDTAGAAAAERSLGTLVQEEFQIKVLTLEAGFDPDLLIRKKGKQAYVDALNSSPRYFDFLIERARARFPARTPEAKAKALNYLLPHIQRINNRIVRDELAADAAQKLAIDSAILRQELKHAAHRRSAMAQAASLLKVSDSEKILIWALASAADSELRSRALQVLDNEGLHHGLSSEPVIEALRTAQHQAEAFSMDSKVFDPMQLDLTESQRGLLAQVLMTEREELSPQLLNGAVEALRRGVLERQQRELKMRIAEAERRNDTAQLGHLMQEKVRIDRALRIGQ